MKKISGLIIMILLIICIISTVPVSADNFEIPDGEYFVVPLDIDYSEDPLEDWSISSMPAFSELFEQYNSSKSLTLDELSDIEEGLAYLDAVDNYYTTKLKKPLLKQFKKVDKEYSDYRTPDGFSAKVLKYTKAEKKLLKIKNIQLAKTNKYYKIFNNIAKQLKKWYKSQLTQIKKYKEGYDIERYWKIIIKSEHKKNCWTTRTSYLVENAYTRYYLIEDRKTNTKKTITIKEYKNAGLTSDAIVKYQKQLGVIKNPDKKSTVKYCFEEPYIDKEGVLHKYFTSIYDDKGNEIVIEINSGIINTIDKTHDIPTDKEYEGIGYIMVVVNEFWDENFKK